MEVEFTLDAQKQLEEWKNLVTNKFQKKISDLIKSIIVSPYAGIGKPEALKHNLAGFWSQRINNEHRLVYQVKENNLIIVQLKYHY